jgi:hypothetical protein
MQKPARADKISRSLYTRTIVVFRAKLKPEGHMRNYYQPTIIDIEASGFGSDSYPIEIGAVKPTGERYCSLIKPLPSWTHWAAEAEHIHHIKRATLERHGKPVAEVCRELNRFLGETNTYSDAWPHDISWLNRLFYDAGIHASFHLSSIELITTEAQLMRWDTTKEQLAKTLKIKRHRASGDAYLILQTYLATLQQTPASPSKADPVKGSLNR